MTEQRPIQSVLKSKRVICEEEKPVRWPYMKILREYSTLKSFYPDINPYVEVYRLKDHLYCLYSDSLDGHGDPWMYLIDGPEKALLIDTSFGLGDLKGLLSKIVGDKEIIVTNTHAHPDHASGNAQFDKVYCHEYEVPGELKMKSPHVWDKLFNESGNPKYAEFDRANMIKFKDYDVIGIPDHYQFDLGGGYIVEAYLLGGHTAGMCAFYDHHTQALFLGDTTSCMGPRDIEFGDYATVEEQHDQLKNLLKIIDEISGIFPGHGALDQSPIFLQYLFDTTDRILKDPENYDYKKTVNGPEGKREIFLKCIYEGSAIRYTKEKVYKKKGL